MPRPTDRPTEVGQSTVAWHGNKEGGKEGLGPPPYVDYSLNQFEFPAYTLHGQLLLSSDNHTGARDENTETVIGRLSVNFRQDMTSYHFLPTTCISSLASTTWHFRMKGCKLVQKGCPKFRLLCTYALSLYLSSVRCETCIPSEEEKVQMERMLTDEEAADLANLLLAKGDTQPHTGFNFRPVLEFENVMAMSVVRIVTRQSNRQKFHH